MLLARLESDSPGVEGGGGKGAHKKPKKHREKEEGRMGEER